jgi:hypothetical protein
MPIKVHLDTNTLDVLFFASNAPIRLSKAKVFLSLLITAQNIVIVAIRRIGSAFHLSNFYLGTPEKARSAAAQLVSAIKTR